MAEEATLTEQTAASPLSQPGAISGTPGYMSPEQAAGKPVDARSDVFSFGALLYEMVTGRRAFTGASRQETLRNVVSVEPSLPSALVGGVPADLDKLILRCMRKDPERRFQHMDDVRVELREIADALGSAPSAGSGAVASRQRWLAPAALGLLLALSAAGWLWLERRRADLPPARVLPLTATSGSESWPSLSPDGSQVAFSWEGEAPAEGMPRDRDIWIQMIGGSETRRVTSGPADDWTPSWSPDGAQIAFLRVPRQAGSEPGSPPPFGPGQGFIHVASPLGGGERRLSDLTAHFSQLSWSPDGRWLAARRARGPDETSPGAGGIHLIPVGGGEARVLTEPPAPGYDIHPAFSPDGRLLAYSSCPSDIVPPCHLYVIALGRDYAQAGPPRRLSRWPGGIHGIAWTRDGRSMVYGVSPLNVSGSGMGAHLWRVDPHGERAPERIESARQGAFAPATAAARDRLVFAQDRTDFDIYRFSRSGPARPVVASSFVDYSPSFSPDGHRIAFESSRSGEAQEIWLSDPDGANARQLTHGPGSWQGTPRFSPDGRRVVFESRGVDGYADVWTIDVEGGPSRRVTRGPRTEGMASWSRDGRFIYYREDRVDGGRDVWRVPDAGGAAERMTRDGGFLARESPDGTTLFYTRTDGKLLARPLSGGPERVVAACVWPRTLADGPDGMYYLGCAPDQPQVPLLRFSPANGRSELLGHVDQRAALGFAASMRVGGFMGMAVSPHAQTILYSPFVAGGSDLMLIEHFR